MLGRGRGWGEGGWRGGGRAVVRRREGVLHLGWGGAEEIERNGDSGGASNILFRCVASPRFLPHLHILPFFSPPPNIPSPISLFRLLPRALPLFSKSLKGGHEGDNANTDPLNREWEEDSCWR